VLKRKMNQSPDQILHNVITAGRACVRIVEAADVLLERDPVWTERWLLRLVRTLYTHRLRGLVAVLPGEITAEILAASDKLTPVPSAPGPVQGFSNN
jgi:hypothetical protein